MKLKLGITVFLFLIISLTISANSEIDSLKIKASLANDNDKIEFFLELANQYISISIDSSISYAIKAKKISHQLTNQKAIAKCNNFLGAVYFSQSKFDSTLYYYQQALIIKKELKDDKGLAITLNNIGNVYFYISNYEKALEFYQNALILFEKIDFKPGIASSLNGSALVQENIKNFKKSIEIYHQALKINQELKEEKQVANILNNLGNVYSKIKEYDSAIILYSKALEIRKNLKDQPGIASSYNNLGIVYRIKGDFSMAIKYFENSLSINKEINNKLEICLNLLSIAKINKELKKYIKANEIALKSIELAKIIGAKSIIQQNYELLAEVNYLLNNPTLAYKNLKLSSEFKDSINSENLQKTIFEMQTKYETEKKESQIEILTKENTIQQLKINKTRYYLVGIVFLLIFIFIISFLSFQQLKLKSQKQNLVLEQRLLRSQMNPHFIFNSLNTLQNQIFEDRKLESAKYLSNFASLLRSILENSREEFILFEKEINTIKNYLELQRVRYSEKFDYTITFSETINPDLLQVPPMLAQPFIENAIKHGLLNSSKKGFIQVKFIRNNGIITCEIIDNGIGRLKAAEYKNTQNDKHTSLAVSITKDRIEKFNKKKNKNVFEIIDLYKDNIPNGTLVRFDFPCKNIC